MVLLFECKISDGKKHWNEYLEMEKYLWFSLFAYTRHRKEGRERLDGI
jgi:hypothetical protein